MPMKLPDDRVGTTYDPPIKHQEQKPIDEWVCSMTEERDVIRNVVETFIPVTLELRDAKDLERMRMRFYRAKRMLLHHQQKIGRPYVARIAFSTDAAKHTLTIKLTESLRKYIIEGGEGLG